MDTPTNNTYRNIIIAAIIIVAVVIAAVALSRPGSPSAVSEDASSTMAGPFAATSTISASPADQSAGMASQAGTVNSPESPASAPSAAPIHASSPWAYSASTAKKSYSQNEVIAVTIKIMNMTDATTSLNFENGCQLSYTIGDFDSSQHTVCIPGGSSIVLGPHAVGTGVVDHYPSVYKIPVGTTTMDVKVVGYTELDLPIVITQ